MNTKVEIPRTTYDGLCRFLQEWGKVYSEPEAVVLRGSLRNPFGAEANWIMKYGGATSLALHYTTALHGMGRAKVRKADALLDLRDLEEEETEAILFVARIALLRGSQTRVLERIAKSAQTFMNLPAMVRIAMAAAD